jgi:Protein of unknown function (DUF1573)
MMKKIMLVVLFLGLGKFAQTQTVGLSQAEITFQKEVHDYGEVKQGGNGDCTFKFTNTGTAPLIVSDAKGSCQCTVPEWPKTPIKPGESASITVHYNTTRVGDINKTVTLYANIEGGTKVVRIKGKVVAAEVAGAPVKTDNGPKADH